MVDRVLGGKLERTLVVLYDETSSWEEVSRRLHADCEVTVSGQTLRRWARELGIGATEPAA